MTLTIKQQISLLIFIFINFLFAVKYISRVTDYYLLAALAISGFYLVLWKSQHLLERISFHAKFVRVLFFLTVVLSVIVLLKLPAEQINADRWSVITSFWDTYFSGEYAYYAKSNVGNEPGPMPFYFILALPFYFIGELGYFSICGMLALYLILRWQRTPSHLVTLSLLLLMSSLFFMWEIVGRSNIFLNGCLVMAVLVWFFNNKISGSSIYLCGLLIGLVLSTRNVFVIPFIIGFIYAIRIQKLDWPTVIKVGIIAFVVFAGTFLPFVWNHFNDFLVMNPFIVQSSFLVPFEYTILFIAMAIATGFICRKASDVYFYSSLVLFLSIAIYYGYHFHRVGFTETFFNSAADISYFILGLPFAMFHFLTKDTTAPATPDNPNCQSGI